MSRLIENLRKCNQGEIKRLEESLAAAKAAQEFLMTATDATLPYEITIRKSCCGPFTPKKRYAGPLKAAVAAARQDYLQAEGVPADDKRIVVGLRFSNGYWMLGPEWRKKSRA